MNFLYNFFKWTRKTTVIVLSFISLVLVVGLVVGSYYLKDGEIVKQFIQALDEIVASVEGPGAGVGITVPEFINTALKFLEEQQGVITDVANGFWIGGIIFAAVFVSILLMSFITWLVYRSKNNNNNKAV